MDGPWVVMLSEMNLTEKYKNHKFIHMWNVKQKKKKLTDKTKQTQSHRDG